MVYLIFKNYNKNDILMGFACHWISPNPSENGRIIKK